MERFHSLQTVDMFLCIKHPVDQGQIKPFIVLLKELSTLKYSYTVIYAILWIEWFRFYSSTERWIAMWVNRSATLALCRRPPEICDRADCAHHRKHADCTCSWKNGGLLWREVVEGDPPLSTFKKRMLLLLLLFFFFFYAGKQPRLWCIIKKERQL